MSFLDVLDSIGTGQRAAAPQTGHSALGASRPLPPPSVSQPHPNRASIAQNGTKRKVGVASEAAAEKPSPRQGPASGKHQGRVPVNASSQPTLNKAGNSASSAVAAKVYPKGSYAALMEEAKAAQEQRTKSEVGLIKHQPTSKVRLSKSARRKQEEEQAMKAKLGKQPQHNSKVEKKARLDPKKRFESSYKGTAKPAPPVSSYKGTAGLPSRYRPSSADARHKGGKNPRRYDEYLGTDEEDEGDESGEEDGYGSNASSDMEADAFDVEEEENRALREARADDAREMALESKLKREKEERRKKLEALAKKRR